ncbi:G1 family glutamic endopeptidase [Streptomyces sp. NPDC048277]|uniref:G1 family glutamic endopeptidase n=1 Tax=Streptomyces sp. NPDC048277 TaxID=3155027 RepID=UPI0033FA9C23
MSARASASIVVAIAAALGTVLATPALAAAPAASPAHTPAQLTQSVASHESHALRGLSKAGKVKASVSSTNWSGYAATGSSGAYTSVTSSWTQPSVTCGSATTYSSFWVGLDGYSNSALEQTGTEADCIGGTAVYGAWWEVLPASESAYSGVTVKGGDKFTATVTYNGSTFAMTLTDSTQGWTKTTTHAGSSGFKNASAEVVAEAPEVGGSVASLANFGTVTFTGAKANGSNLDTFSPTEIVMTKSNGSTVRAQPGSISGGSFSDVWKAS